MSIAVPNHIAIVMDGNGRWATRRFLPRAAGHKAGVDALRRCVRACASRGVTVLTVFAFSSENWSRPKEVPQLVSDGVCLRFLGERAGLSAAVRSGLVRAEAATAGNSRLFLNVCFNYGGRWDIVQAANRLAQRGEAVTEESLGAEMQMGQLPEPDLIIRTGGEQRLSNFLLWQAAYSELYFCDTLWPEFDESALDSAIAAFSLRERRFGKTSEQLREPAPSQQAA
jgi:undecaprenyl diphosphate synthase